MIAAAIYARVSHKDEGDDRTRSVARQVQDARAYATRKGWTVPDEHVYIDDEVSAVDWGKRHAWARLTDNLGHFGALLVWEQSRIGRDAQALVALERVEEAGVKVWNYDQDRQISVLEESGEVEAVVGNLMDRIERRRARTRAIAARRSRVANGGVGGGRVLGYRNVGEVKTKRREVDPAQAALVVRLFEMHAKGVNPTGQDRLGKRHRVSGVWS